MNMTKNLTLPLRDGTRAKAKNLLLDTIPKATFEGTTLEEYCETHKSINNSQIKNLASRLIDKKIKKKVLDLLQILETYAQLDLFIGKRDNITSVYCRNCKNGVGSLNYVENGERFQGYYAIDKAKEKTL